MRKIVWISCLLLYTSVCFTQVHKGFRWIGKSHILYKVDLETGELSQEIPKQQSVSLGIIQAWDNLRKDLPGDFEVVPHYIGDSLIITIPGTGQVYRLDVDSLKLERLDKTFFRGYNFNANQFMRKDTIFSIGGEGFWQKHSLITFYDPRNYEWSIYKTGNQNVYSTLNRFSGYSPQKDAFFSVNISSSFFQDSADTYLSVFSFKDRKWEVKGSLNQQLKEAIKTNFRSVWTGDYLFIFNIQHKEKTIILDPFNNVQYAYESPNDHFFLFNTEIYAQNGYLYSRDLTSTGAIDKKGMDSLSIKEVMLAAQKTGQIYTSPIPIYYYIIAILFIIAFASGYFVWKKRNTRKSCPLALSETELASVKEFIAHPDKKFTTLEVNTLLNIEKKTYDNQRQIRNRIISTINQQFLTVLENKELIYRSPNAEDKRMMEYYVNPELKPKELEKVKESLVIGH